MFEAIYAWFATNGLNSLTFTGIGAAIVWALNFKANKRIKNAEASMAELDVCSKKESLKDAELEALREKCDLYQKEFFALADENRKAFWAMLKDYEDQQSKIHEKCNEIADLKELISRLMPIRCYDMTCKKRIKEEVKTEK